jgi:hypothetical protein
MINPYKKESNVLEKFRITAHLRSYVKDPIVVNESLMDEAVEKLKKLPYEDKDPTDPVAIELVIDSYRLGYFKYDDLTEDGIELVRYGKYRRHNHQPAIRPQHSPVLRNSLTLKLS